MRSSHQVLTAISLCLSVALGADHGSNPSLWQAIDIRGLTQGPLSRITFVNDRTGWIVAGLNSILRTADGGQSWSLVSSNLSGTDNDVTGLSFVDEDRGWASGSTRDGAAIWQTQDGGRSWVLQERWPTTSDGQRSAMLDVHFVSKLQGWAVGTADGKAIIVATQDGGLRWTIGYQGSEITSQFSRVHFSDHLNGWVLSLDAVMQTDDGGSSWHLRRYDPAVLNDIEAIEPEDAWVAGAWGHVLHTSDGIRWSRVRIPRPQQEFFGWVRFVDRLRGWVSGTKCNIASTKDGGKTWQQEACPLAAAPAFEISTGEMVRTRSHLYILSSSGYVFVRKIG
jgi:photosystem II stability/assembly factor-like uncharacterized protein